MREYVTFESSHSAGASKASSRRCSRCWCVLLAAATVVWALYTWRHALAPWCAGANLTADLVRSSSSGPPRHLPSAIIIGARKAGTRALLEMIALHPQVVKAQHEIHFFDRDTNYERGLDWYISRMPVVSSNQLVIEKTPSYLTSATAPLRAYRMDRNLRLILLVREPVERMISDFTQLARKRVRLALPAGQTFRERVLCGDNVTVRKDSSLLQHSLYYRHVRRWRHHFPASSLLVLESGALTADPVSTVRRVESFLRLTPRITQRNFVFNATKGFYCLCNTFAAADSCSGKTRCLSASKGLKHIQIDENLKHRLRRYFAPHNNKFYNLVGHDFHWPTQ